MTHKWEEKCPWSTASPGLKLVHPLAVWARKIVLVAYTGYRSTPNAIGLGAISSSCGSWEPKIPSVQQKVMQRCHPKVV